MTLLNPSINYYLMKKVYMSANMLSVPAALRGVIVDTTSI